MSASSLKVLTIFTALDKVTPVVDKVSKSSSSVQKNLDKISGKMLVLGGSVMTVAGGALNEFVKFEDKMTDIEKVFNEAPATFQQQFQKVEKGILEMSKKTRTSIADLQEMSYQAGRIGIAGKDMLPFLEVINKFNVALGEDFPGGARQASEEVTKLVYLFKDMDSTAPARELNRIGSAINDLVQGGIASAENLTNFSQRFSGLPEVFAPVSSSILALGTTLESMGTEWEIAASGSKRFLAVALDNLPLFAKQMGISKQAALDLIQTDSAQFIVNFSQSLKGLNAEELQGKLKSLKINLQGTRDVVGKLASDKGLELWNKNLAISTREIEKATSITEEYGLKNDNSAGKLGQLKNAVSATSIEVGRALVPALTEVMGQLSPILNALATWVGENPNVITGVVGLAAAMFTLGTAIKIYNAAMIVSKGVMIALNFVRGIYLAMTGQIITATVANAVVIKGMVFAMKIATAAQWLWNAAMSANPIGLIIIAIAGLIALIVAIIAKWDEWGAAVSLFLGPLGFVISLIQSFREHWDSIKKAFQDGGIIGGLKRIGQVLLNALLYPVQQLLEILSNIPGLGNLSKAGADIIYDLRKNMDVLSEGEKKKEALSDAKVAEMRQSRAEDKYNRENKNSMDINVNDPFGVVKSVKSNNIPVKLNNTKIPTR